MDEKGIPALIWRWISGLSYIVYVYLEALYRLIVPPPMKSIDGETILVTGAVGGIGKEICRHLVRSGSNTKLVLWDLNQADLDKFAVELRKLGGGKGVTVFPLAVDISTKESITDGAKLVKDTVGPVSIVFNNAGIAPFKNFLQHTDNEIELTHQINLLSHLWTLRQFLPDMVLRNHGRIVNTCSVVGLQPTPYSLTYVSSKYGVNGYTESLKMELHVYKYDGIHCTTLYPHFVQTPMILSAKMETGVFKRLPGPLGRVVSPAHVAEKVVDGMRREYEFVCVPSIMPFAVFALNFLPLKLRRQLEAIHFPSAISWNETDWNRLSTSYGEHLRSINYTGSHKLE